MTTAATLIREFFPDATEDEVDFILWERTAFPFNSADGLREQIAEFKDMVERYPKARLCDFCNQLALVEDCCVTCAVAFAPDASRLLTSALSGDSERKPEGFFAALTE